MDQKSEAAFCLIHLNELGLSFHNCKLIGIKKDDDCEDDDPCPVSLRPWEGCGKSVWKVECHGPMLVIEIH